jgi:2,3-dihydroxybenzoate-AMP ligase
MQEVPGVVYQPKEKVARFRANGTFADETLPAALRASFRRNAVRTALADTERSITYAQLDRLTDQGAAALLGLGLRPLDRMIFQLPNSIDLVVVMLSALKCGVIPVCTLAAHRKHEIEYLAGHSGARAHVVASDPKFDFIGLADDIREGSTSMEYTIVMSGDGDGNPHHRAFWSLAAAESAGARDVAASQPTHAEQVVYFQLYGGTSGVPKIIPRFHNEYVYSARSVIDWFGYDESLVTYSPMPMMHNAPMLFFLIPALLVGGEIAVAADMTPSVIAELFAVRKPTWMSLPPALLLRLRDAGLLDGLSWDHVRGIISPIGADITLALTGIRQVSNFGMTEGLICFGHPNDPPDAFKTVGRTISEHDELRVFEPGTENDVAAGETGELVIRGPATFAGYFDAPERNAEVFTSEGFFRTGDLMSFETIDGTTYLKFQGRVKDLVNRGGEKINCVEVETLAMGFPTIQAVSLVPMSDEFYGERACAFVIMKPGAPDVTVRELGAYLESRGVAKFKWPERIEIVTEFPSTASGKPSKPLLREAIEAKRKAETLVTS